MSKSVITNDERIEMFNLYKKDMLLFLVVSTVNKSALNFSSLTEKDFEDFLKNVSDVKQITTKNFEYGEEIETEVYFVYKSQKYKIVDTIRIDDHQYVSINGTSIFILREKWEKISDDSDDILLYIQSNASSFTILNMD